MAYIPGLSLRSNPGLELANAFGVVDVYQLHQYLLTVVVLLNHSRRNKEYRHHLISVRVPLFCLERSLELSIPKQKVVRNRLIPDHISCRCAALWLKLYSRAELPLTHSGVGKLQSRDPSCIRAVYF